MDLVLDNDYPVEKRIKPEGNIRPKKRDPNEISEEESESETETATED